MEKVACFIDGGYLQKILSSFSRPRINHTKLIELMKGRDQLLRAYYYDCRSLIREGHEQEDEVRQSRQDKFFDYLQSLPQFECKFGMLKQYIKPNGEFEFVQKQVDVLMAIDLVTLSAKHLITQAKIMTGDSDLIPAIQVVKNEGVVVELFYLNGSTTVELLKTTDIATPIDHDFIEKTLSD
ncbi:MAG: NYN domain-containing protein [Quinella sp. 2Q5]|nr:NYN domain-containing protein [Quinella sp. 2Q5]